MQLYFSVTSSDYRVLELGIGELFQKNEALDTQLTESAR